MDPKDQTQQTQETEDERIEREQQEQAQRGRNPRYAVMEEIEQLSDAQREEEAKEFYPEVDENGNPIQAQTDEEETQTGDEQVEQTQQTQQTGDTQPAVIDPEQEYELEVDGQIVRVKGSKIFERGRQALQKDSAADVRLELANRLLAEAESRSRGAPPSGGRTEETPRAPTDDGVDFSEVVKAVQLGTPEQAVQALQNLVQVARKGTVTADHLERVLEGPMMARIQDHLERRDAITYAEREFEDMWKNPYLQRLFFIEERRRRAPREQGGEADPRPHKELFKDIGVELRRAFNVQKPAPSNGATPAVRTVGASTRQERKAGAPQVPAMAGARLGGKAPQKEETVLDVINESRRARHQPQI